MHNILLVPGLCKNKTPLISVRSCAVYDQCARRPAFMSGYLYWVIPWQKEGHTLLEFPFIRAVIPFMWS